MNAVSCYRALLPHMREKDTEEIELRVGVDNMAGCAGSSRNLQPDKLLLSVTPYNLKEDTTYTVDRG